MDEISNIGQQLNEMCKHHGKHIKPINDMQICKKAINYCQQLIDGGEMSLIQCEPCVIQWICDDPIETCMDQTEIHQWYEQCVQNATFWQKHIETAWNKPKWWKCIKTHTDYGVLVYSLLKCMEMHGMHIKLVK